LVRVAAARSPRNDRQKKVGEKGASLSIMCGMTLSPLAIQLGIALILILSIAVPTLSFRVQIAQGRRRAYDSSDLAEAVLVPASDHRHQ
jgi:hypothetical protein